MASPRTLFLDFTVGKTINFLQMYNATLGKCIHSPQYDCKFLELSLTLEHLTRSGMVVKRTRINYISCGLDFVCI